MPDDARSLKQPVQKLPGFFSDSGRYAACRPTQKDHHSRSATLPDMWAKHSRVGRDRMSSRRDAYFFVVAAFADDGRRPSCPAGLLHQCASDGRLSGGASEMHENIPGRTLWEALGKVDGLEGVGVMDVEA